MNRDGSGFLSVLKFLLTEKAKFRLVLLPEKNPGKSCTLPRHPALTEDPVVVSLLVAEGPIVMNPFALLAAQTEGLFGYSQTKIKKTKARRDRYQ